MGNRPQAALPALRDFQDGFARALLKPEGADPASADLAALQAQPGFAVYRNTVVKGCIEALHANYPSVARLVGDEGFRAAAAVYVRRHLPADPALVRYGDAFEGFLSTFEPTGELQYLHGVARLDRFWTEVHTARNEACVDASTIAALDGGTLARVALTPLAAARWAWFDTLPILTIWRRNRAPAASDETEIDWRGEGALLVRAQDAVHSFALDAGGCAFLDVCATGGTLAEAGVAALAANSAIDVAVMFARLLDAGAFARVTVQDRLPAEP